jgi:tyrosyl-tRNA synthetase
MSIPDHLIEPYLQQLTEWTDQEIHRVAKRRDDGTAHPMDLKRILAGEVVAALHSTDAAATARHEFTARFSKRSYTDTENLPVVHLTDRGEETLGSIITRELAFTPSLNAAKRVAQQNGLRLVTEADTGQTTTALTDEALYQPLREIVAAAGAGRHYLRVGRKIAEIR